MCFGSVHFLKIKINFKEFIIIIEVVCNSGVLDNEYNKFISCACVGDKSGLGNIIEQQII